MANKKVLNVYYDEPNNRIIWGYDEKNSLNYSYLIDNLNLNNILNLTDEENKNYYSVSPFKSLASFPGENILISYNGENSYLFNLSSEPYLNKVIGSPTADIFYLGNLNSEQSNHSYFAKTINLQNFFNNTSTFYCQNVSNLFSDGVEIQGNIVNFPNAVDISYLYNGCSNLIGEPVCGPFVTNMTNTYFNCQNLTGGFNIGINVVYMNNAYRNCINLTGNVILPFSVKYISNAFSDTNSGNTYDFNTIIKNIYIPSSVEEASCAFKNTHIAGDYLNFDIGPNLNLIDGHFGKTFFGTEKLQSGANFYLDENSRVNNRLEHFYINSFYQNLNLCNVFYGLRHGFDGLLGYSGGYISVYINGKITNLDNAFRTVGWIESIHLENLKNLKSLNNTFDLSRVKRRSQTNEYGIYFNNFDNNNILYLESTFGASTQSDFNFLRNFKISDIMGNNTIDISNFMRYMGGNFAPYCGPNVIDMSYAYADTNVNIAVCGPNVINMANAYSGCSKLKYLNLNNNLNIEKVQDMGGAFYDCRYLEGPIICGNNVLNMSFTYRNCMNLIGNPICGNNIINMVHTYDNCYNITGEPVIGINVINMISAYSNCTNLYGNPTFGNHEGRINYNFDFRELYFNCPNLYGNLFLNFYCQYDNGVYPYLNFYHCFSGRNKQNKLNVFIKYDNVNRDFCLPNTFGASTSLVWLPMENGVYNEEYNIYIYRNKFNYLNTAYILNMDVFQRGDINSFVFTTQSSNIYSNQINSEGEKVYWDIQDNVLYVDTPAEHLFLNERVYFGANLSGNLQNLFPNENDLFSKVINMYGAFYNISYRYLTLSGNAICGINTINFGNCYTNVQYITKATCGDNVLDMGNTYSSCSNITEAVCGNNVTYMYNTYAYCNNLQTAVCGPNVRQFNCTYMQCNNLTTPVCGPEVTNMCLTYRSCYNLIGPAVCGDKVIQMIETYAWCGNLEGEAVCGPNVISMNYAYHNCNKITSAQIGNNVAYLVSTFENCHSLSGNINFYNNNLEITEINMYHFLYRWNQSACQRINIRVKYGSAFNSYLYNGSDVFYGRPEWTPMDNGYFNEYFNVYVYYNL